MPFFGGGGASAGIGGSTGATDNAILRADGTGAATLQNSDLNIDDASTSTQNNVAITNQHSGQTNSALVLTPKGTGAFIVGPKPDGTSTGGNARGQYAVCIQTRHNSASQVASGADSISIGQFSTASGDQSISIGYACGSYGALDGVNIGNGSAVQASRSISLGKSAVCNSSAGNAVALGHGAQSTAERGISIGYSASATAQFAVCITGANNQTPTANLRSQFVTWPFRAIHWGGTTTNATPTTLNIMGDDGGGTSDRLVIAANTAAMVDLNIVARRTDTVDKWFSSRRTVAIRRNNANGTAIIGSVQTIGTDQTEGSPTWSVAITADDTNEALQVQVTGAAGETVSWRVMAFYQVV